MKILALDIETSLMIVPTFGLFNQNISQNYIMKDWVIYGGAWKWIGDDEVQSIYGDEEVVTSRLRDLVAEADVVVYHNGDKFDLKKLNTKILQYRLQPLPKVVSVDTLKVAKKLFGFTSNRLDYIARFLGFGGKLETSKDMWFKALNGDTNILKEMEEYNKVDVVILEKVYLEMRPHMHNHPNMNLYKDEFSTMCCTNCGSSKIKKWGFYYTRAGKYQRYVCQSCGAYCKSRKSSLNSEVN